MSGNRIRDAPKEEKVMLKKVFVSVLTAVMLLGGIGAGAAFEPDIDYAQEANPAIFTPSLTREFYNSARNAYLHSAEMAAGYDHDTVTLNRSITIPLPARMAVNEDMRGVCNRIGGVTYRFNITEINPFVYAYPRMDADLEKPHVRAIIEAAQSMETDREKKRRNILQKPSVTGWNTPMTARLPSGARRWKTAAKPSALATPPRSTAWDAPPDC